jgi:hypothetical protein
VDNWETRVAEAWASFDEYEDREGEFRALIDGLAAELPEGDPGAAFEQACAWDSTGHSDRAVPLYQRALDQGLTGYRRRRAVIQLSSSLRNVGQVGTVPGGRRTGTRGGVGRGRGAGPTSSAVPAFDGQLRAAAGVNRELVDGVHKPGYGGQCPHCWGKGYVHVRV